MVSNDEMEVELDEKEATTVAAFENLLTMGVSPEEACRVVSTQVEHHFTAQVGKAITAILQARDL